MAFSETWLLKTLDTLRKRRGDSTSVEVKRAQGGLPKNLDTTLCAFANMPNGGILILGVDESLNFKITGVDDPAKLESGVASLARNEIDPPLTIESSVITVHVDDGARLTSRRSDMRAARRSSRKATHEPAATVRVVVVKVHGLPLSAKPARVGGSSGVAYLRQSDGDYRMSDNELRMIEVAKLHADQVVLYDDKPVVGTSVADLDKQLMKQMVDNIHADSARLREVETDKLLELLRICTQQGELTVAGLYALGFLPQGSFPSLNVTLAERLVPDESGRRTSGLQRLTGPIPVLLSEAMEWIRSHLHQVQRYDQGGDMVDESEIPLGAIREAVANALVHRDLGPDTLGIGQTVDIRLTPDALVITNPGGLRGLSVERLLSSDLSRHEVNQRLYSLCTYLRTSDGKRIIEGEGGGIREILREVAAARLPEPLFIDHGVRFTVKFFRPTSVGLLAEPQTQYRSAITGKVIHTQQSTTGQPQVSTAPTVLAVSTETRAQQEPAEPRDLSAYGRNAEPIVQALSEDNIAMSVKEIAERSGLNSGQVRYALRSLTDGGVVEMTLPDAPQSRNQKYRLR